jgi:glycosyltransferase involved in cell wall biosynthesis
MGGPFFSIIIPTFFESKLLRNALESIKHQDFNDYEILVCDYGSTDGTIQIAKEYGARVLSVNRPSASFARNYGAFNARGQYVVFLDADTTMSSSCLSLFKREAEVGTLGGFARVKWATDVKLYEVFRKYMINPIYFLASLLKSAISYPCCCFYKKDIFLNTDGFDTRTAIFSNFDLNRDILRQGNLKFLQSAVCFTSDRRVRDLGIPSYCLTAVYAFFIKALKDKVIPLDFYTPIR